MTTAPENTEAGGAPKGAASFCIPKAAINALLDAGASALDVCTYLTLARSTDATGMFSTAGPTAVRRAINANMDRIRKCLIRLQGIRAVRTISVPNGRTGKGAAMVKETIDLGPILMSREDFLKANPEAVLPDGPHDRAKVLFVLPFFGEDIAERVWIGSGLVGGVRDFGQPLKALYHAGDAAARLLLTLYEANDMEVWGGVRPVGPGRGPWQSYMSKDKDASISLSGGARLLRAEVGHIVAIIDERISGGDDDKYWQALYALESTGLVYQMLMVLNRNPIPGKFASGEEYGRIPDDAEPYYELDCLSQHGHKPAGEEGIAGATARTAGELGYPVTRSDGTFWGYASIVPRGYGTMIAGIYRLRFRVANPKNASVRDAWTRIRQGNRDALEYVNRVRAANKLSAIPAPWKDERAAAPAKQGATAGLRDVFGGGLFPTGDGSEIPF